MMSISIPKIAAFVTLAVTLGGCASDPVVTSQTTSTRRVTSSPMTSVTVPAPVVQQTSTTTSSY